MDLWQVFILALVQGLAELLPVSSSAHVILAQHLMGLDPSAPQMTFLLVMLHTGTMFAVLIYFGKRWKELLTQNSSESSPKKFITSLFITTGVTGLLGLSLKFLIEKIVLEKWLNYPKGEVEELFKMLPLISLALLTVGAYIIYVGTKITPGNKQTLTHLDSIKIGIIQAICLPFRGFSRSGATISAGLTLGLSRQFAEEFSFALAVLLTPPVIALQVKRLLQSDLAQQTSLQTLFFPGLIGMFFSFLSGTLALRWLSSWLEKGRWQFFGYYCLFFALIILYSHFAFPQ